MKPEDMRFSKEHEWVKAENGEEEAVVGITDYAAGELGDIIFVELPQVGAEVSFMQPMGTIEAVKTVADVYSPISGVVKEVNGELEDHPEIVNNSPFDKGWFVRVQMKDPDELGKLMTYEEYKAMLGKE